MKNFAKLSLTAFMLIISATIFAQNIPNAGFENWSSHGFPSYIEPDGWGSLNGSTAGINTCERGSGADVHTGSYSIKLTSKFVFIQNAPGIAVTGTINTGTEELEGGFPYTQRPTHLAGWYKYSPASGDNCEINLTLWRRSPQYEEVGTAVLQSTTSVPSFTRFMIPINYTSANAPDSGRILLVSTNTDDIQLGSELIVDDLQFVDCSTLNVTASANDITYVGNDDGQATTNVTGGSSPYTYAWNNASTTPNLTGLPGGNYCVTVTDDNGCTVTDCAMVNEPDCSGFSVSVSTSDATTVGGNDGTASADVTGGTPPFDYLWGNTATTDSLSNLTAAIYCVTVTDSVGCTDDACGTVSDPGCSGFNVTVDSTDVTTVGGTDGTATANPTGGVTPYSYLWNTGDTTQTITGLIAGNYCVTVTDAAQCQKFGCVDVKEPDCSGFSVTLSTDSVTMIGGSDGMVTANPTGGTAPHGYLWNTNDTTQTITGPAGNYCVTVTDNVLCRDTQCIEIYEPSCANFSVSVNATDESVAGANDGKATATATGGTGVTYDWSDGSTGSNITGLAPDQYCVTATDDNGCTATACDSVRAGEPVGIARVNKIKVAVYANASFIRVDFADDNGDFVLYDLSGKIMINTKVNSGTNRIGTALLTEGIYFYRLQANNLQLLKTGKLVIQR